MWLQAMGQFILRSHKIHAIPSIWPSTKSIPYILNTYVQNSLKLIISPYYVPIDIRAVSQMKT
ncbi:hypothetical protein Xmlh_05810 [Xanthomonas axonopodis pv. melhusii]|uniref:Uncharacterized protein n=1 Tax=Xanthomonas axonopodis pv. melhusii TaxID=487834 RepID=A0A1T1PAU7_9XANT|nr:hypothetical protein Xmlh_05810 [Xanthomonas axonopodis pv. melhusii]